MAVHAFAGFVADFPTEFVDGELPAGLELARFLRRALVVAGLDAREPYDHGYAWAVHTFGPAGWVFTLVGFVDETLGDPPRQWLVTNQLQRSAFSRWLGGPRSQARGEALLEQVCVVLHQAMRADSRFTELRWHDPETFDEPGDRPRVQPLER